jgi:hypothetical protein
VALVKLDRTLEAVASHMKDIKSCKVSYARSCDTADGINQVSGQSGDRFDKPTKKKACYKCGGDYPHRIGKVCPAIGKLCNRCKKEGHFAKCCRNKDENQMNGRQQLQMLNSFAAEYETESVWRLDDKNGKLPKISLEIFKTKEEFTIDTGATVNLLDEKTFNQMVIRPKLGKSSVKIFAYGSEQPIDVLGELKARTLFKGQYKHIMIQVVKGNGGNVLGHNTLIEMEIIKIVRRIETTDSLVEELSKKYPGLFSNQIGKLKNQLIKLHINRDIKPVRQRYRPSAIHLRAGIEKAIQKMLENDIIEPVKGATPWVYHIVPLVKANGDIRICTDAKQLNTALEREVHNAPTVDEVALELNGAKVISKFDLRSGYNQLELHPESRDVYLPRTWECFATRDSTLVCAVQQKFIKKQ